MEMNRKPSRSPLRRQRFFLALAACLGLSVGLAGAPAWADIILLTNGKTLEGTLEELSNGKVRVRLGYGSLSLSREQIATVHRAHTLDEIIEDALEGLAPQDAQGRYRLARQAQEEHSLTLYRRLLEKVVAIDSDHEAARRELGYLPHDGTWVTEAQLHKLQGEVSFRGEWMAAQTRDQILIAEASGRRASEERRQAQFAAVHQRREAAAAAEREAETLAARPAGFSSTFQPGRSFGFASGAYGFGRIYGGYGGYGGYGYGPAYQPLQPFQPGQIQVPNQTYRYSFHQTFSARPGRGPRPYVGYRADPPPRRRR